MMERTARHGVGICASALGATATGVASLIAMACCRAASHGWAASAPDGTTEISRGLETLTLAAAGLVAAWLALLLLLGSVAALPGRSTAPLRALAARLAPRLAPRVAAGLVTAVISLTPLGAAYASTGAPSAPGVPAATGAVSSVYDPAQSLEGSTATSWDTTRGAGEAPGEGAPEPGWRPTAPQPTPDPDAITLVSRGTAEPDAVVVRAGDTLWHIAARHLGDDADAAAIAEAWPHWYETNRAVIGPDPDYLLPGTRLVPPQTLTASPQVAP